MKTLLLPLFFGAILASLQPATVRADGATATPTPTASEPAEGKAAKMEKFKALLAQLDLTDAQKAQVKQILTSEPAGKERREHIKAVLTPDQKAKLKELIQARRDGNGA